LVDAQHLVCVGWQQRLDVHVYDCVTRACPVGVKLTGNVSTPEMKFDSR
jgi:hypothetical protein